MVAGIEAGILHDMKQAQFQPSVVISEVLRSGLSGLVFALAAYFWFSKFHLEDGFTAPDWFDYCSGVISLLEDEYRLWPLKRSRAAGWVAAGAATKLGLSLIHI